MTLNLAGMEPRELEMVGGGVFWELLKDAGYRTVADLRAVSSDEAVLDFMRAVQAALDRLRASSPAHVVDW